MFIKDFHITNLECHSCIALSTDVLKDLPGVKDVTIDEKTGAVHLMAEQKIAWDDIAKSLADVGKTTSED